MKVSMTINDTEVSAEVEPRTLLVHFIREQASLKGTNIGCDSSSCGACTVHLNGESVKSCTVLAVQADEQEVTTIEGLADGENLHPMQEAFRDCHALQCGYCTPGFLMLAKGVVERGEDLPEEELRHLLSSNLCRCTGYQNIIAAVRAAIVAFREKAAGGVEQTA